MRSKSWFTLLIAAVGFMICLGAVAQFVLVIFNNQLEWTEGFDARQHYLAVGHFYAQGFVVGFFFCFSMALLGVSIGSWRARVLQRRGTVAHMGAAFAPHVIRPSVRGKAVGE